MRYRGNVRRLCTAIVPRTMIVMLLLVAAAPVKYVIVRIAMVFAVFVGPDGPSRFYRRRHCTLSDTNYDRTVERRLTPPLASHQQRCHITLASLSIGQVFGHRQTGTMITAFLVLARDRLFHSICSLLFPLACDLLRSHRRRLSCSVLSCPALSCPVPFRSVLSYTGHVDVSYIAEQSRFPLRPQLVTDSPKPFAHTVCLYTLLPLLSHSFARARRVCCVAATEGHARQLMIAVVVVATIDCGFGRCIEIHRTP